ncbi:hypothetical protein CNMCM5793_009221 [Aspergillus hiratsukae]|uniref:Uncharacterized protein n=1 Tax=Aspergillus hiratsukae TaxID=1194566 RepID=A0A8H6PJY4_9EURO|nr:hypothetical protein CNMCM5793_009221 [Aspergillus hiratsukae]KAF7155694.1 hypothetical protein CNMCM6106_005976 [Aspergillus hiratsukae]
MDQSEIEGYHDNSLPGRTTTGNTWTGNTLARTVGSGITVTPSSEIDSAGMPAAWGGSGISTDDTVRIWGAGLGTGDTGYGNGSGRESTSSNPADSTSSKVSESTKRSTTTEPATGGGSTNNGVNGGATNTGSGTNVNVNTGAANGAEKDKGVVDTLLGKLTSIIKTLR